MIGIIFHCVRPERVLSQPACRRVGVAGFHQALMRGTVRPTRLMSTAQGLSSDEFRRRLEDFQEHFAEARMCLDDARESAGSSYFADDILDAKEATDKAAEMYAALLADLDEERRE